MSMYDIAIIGAGWAGIGAARHARECGLKVCLIEKEELGGVCLNRGCIPTKALLKSAALLSSMRSAARFGIAAENVYPDYKAMHAHKDEVVGQLRKGIDFLLKGIERIQGEASFADEHTLQVRDRQITARTIIIATGSKPIELKSLPFDRERVLSSDGLLACDSAVGKLAVIGGGYIGCEFACLFRALGSEVTILEKEASLLPAEDPEVARKLTALFQKQGITVLCSLDTTTYDFSGFDKVLVAVGRVPAFEGVNLQRAGLALQENTIPLNEYLQSPVPHIYAAGDCTGAVMLAHYADFQGRLIVRNIVSPQERRPVHSAVVPRCIFSRPEIGCVGLQEHEAASSGREVSVHRFDYRGSGMAHILDEKDGFIKIIADRGSAQVLGGSLIGPYSTELIALLTLAVTSGLTLDALRSTIFAHPTVAESIRDTVISHGSL